MCLLIPAARLKKLHFTRQSHTHLRRGKASGLASLSNTIALKALVSMWQTSYFIGQSKPHGQDQRTWRKFYTPPTGASKSHSNGNDINPPAWKEEKSNCEYNLSQFTFLVIDTHFLHSCTQNSFTLIRPPKSFSQSKHQP